MDEQYTKQMKEDFESLARTEITFFKAKYERTTWFSLPSFDASLNISFPLEGQQNNLAEL